MKKNRWTKNDIEKLPEWARAQIEAQLAGHPDTIAEHSQLGPLVRKAPAPAGLVDIAGPLLVRITRVGPRPLDDDNLSGGCKELRDAAAALLGRKNDSQEAGLFWEYCQEQGPPETIIEFYERSKT